MLFKVLVVASLAVAAVCAQEAPEQAGAPEPYAYGYQTDTHQASEQRSPDNRVTGFYSIVDPTDGRERRVEYYADETGFHAKVATNEVGTKSESPADVEVQAAPPTEAQFAYKAQTQQYQVAAPQAATAAYKQVTTSYQQPQYFATYQQQPQFVGAYQPRYYAQPQYGYGYGSGYGSGYGTSYGTGYGTGYGSAYGYQAPAYGNYNYHTPGQYYSSIQGAPAVTGYTGAGQNVVASRYVSSTGGVRAVPAGGASTYTTYSSGPVAQSTRTISTRSQGSSGSQGSGNLLLLKKA